MGKKPTTKPSVATEGGRQLTHSPFASLASSKTIAGSANDAAQTASSRASLGDTTPPSAADSATPGKPRGRLVLRRETKHRGGRPVIIVTGFGSTGMDDAALEALTKQLKRTLACGGTLQQVGAERELVLQADQPAKVAELLRSEGFRVAGVVS
jgi:translation initiation factor 1 (eIF-1/SUI1)